MADPTDLDSAELGETTWPALDVFSEESLGGNTSDLSSAHSDLKRGHIRLIKIQPGDRGSIIRCHTQIALLGRNEDYTALSYTWGSTLLSQPVEIDGHRRLLPKNLWRFLRQARACPQQFSGWLWIDMISIDQTCAWERTHQVKIMSDIFRKAKTVVVWAGPAYGESDKALETLSKANPANKKMLTRICSGPVCSAVQRFCERPYWRRLWVFQEVKFARNIILMCGEKLVSWSKFQGFLLHARAEAGTPRLKDKVDTFLHSPAGAMVELTLKSLDTSLWALLLATRHLRCAVLHDKVYALLSVAETGHEAIKPDYTMPINVLLNQILRNMNTLSPPRELDEVASQCETLASLFGVSSEALFTLPATPTRTIGPRATCYPEAYRLGPSKYPFSLWWADRYRHREVQRLLLRSWDYNWFQGDQSPTPDEVHATKEVLTRCCFDANAGQPGHRYLQLAIELNDLAVLKLLLALPNLDVDMRNNKGENPLYQAISAGHFDMVSELIASGLYDVNRHLSQHRYFWTTYRRMPKVMRDVLKQALTSEAAIVAQGGSKEESYLSHTASSPIDLRYMDESS